MKDKWIIEGKQWECASIGEYYPDDKKLDATGDTLLLFEGWLDDGFLAIYLHDLQEMQKEGRAVKL